MADQIPASLDDDVVMNILSRLPVKKLVQSTLVSKHWYSLIKDPALVRAHIARSISQLAATTTDHYILVAHRPSVDEHMLSIFADDGDYDLCCKVKIPSDTSLETLQIVGCCNGLVCFTDQTKYYGEVVYLLNPVIRKLKTLEPVKGSYLLKFYDEEYSITPVLGFGFCKPDEDFRVVRILYLREPILDKEVGPVVEVYSLKSGKWRGIKAKINRTISRDSNAFLDGCIYWVAAKSANARISWVVWFDLKDEVFHEVNMPENYDKNAGGNNLTVNIMRWNGEVAIGAIEPVGVWNHVRCGFWVLKKDDGGKLLWEGKFWLRLPEPWCGIPAGFSCSGKDVIYALHKHGCCSPRKVNAELTRIFALNHDEMKFKKYLLVARPHSVATCFAESLALF